MGQSRTAITRLRTAGARIRMGVQLAQHAKQRADQSPHGGVQQQYVDNSEAPEVVERLHLAADPSTGIAHGHSSLVHSRSYRNPETGEHSPHADFSAGARDGGYDSGVGSAWAEMAAGEYIIAHVGGTGSVLLSWYLSSHHCAPHWRSRHRSIHCDRASREQEVRVLPQKVRTTERAGAAVVAADGSASGWPGTANVRGAW